VYYQADVSFFLVISALNNPRGVGGCEMRLASRHFLLFAMSFPLGNKKKALGLSLGHLCLVVLTARCCC
jgi:hypothetical protein